MKRARELHALSKDHHSGLVLAKKAKRVMGGEGGALVCEIWADIEVRFKAELEPHFQIEEALIATNLEAQGESKLVKRLYKEHDALRQFFAPGSGRTPADLWSFGELLEKHIRFEERELFEVVQNTLSPDVLSAIEQACCVKSCEESE